MILDLILAIVLLVLSLSLLLLMVFALRSYQRHKRAIVEGMAQLDDAFLAQVGWCAKTYISVWDLFAPFRYGWGNWGRMFQVQQNTLQRVLVHGLPQSARISTELANAAKKYRWYSAGLAMFIGGFILLPGIGRMSGRLADFTGWPVEVCALLSGLAILPLALVPREKFKKWPELESDE